MTTYRCKSILGLCKWSGVNPELRWSGSASRTVCPECGSDISTFESTVSSNTITEPAKQMLGASKEKPDEYCTYPECKCPLDITPESGCATGKPILSAVLPSRSPENKRPADIERMLRNSPLDTQEGGSHYKTMSIQPVEYIHANNIGYCEGAVIKYVSRWRSKNGIEDLRKARHFIDLLIELEASHASDNA
ncbi:MAG TPA: DUF3310 domain-containing protein [Candidatus Obscuribacterales bacterium]